MSASPTNEATDKVPDEATEEAHEAEAEAGNLFESPTLIEILSNSC